MNPRPYERGRSAEGSIRSNSTGGVSMNPRPYERGRVKLLASNFSLMVAQCEFQ